MDDLNSIEARELKLKEQLQELQKEKEKIKLREAYLEAWNAAIKENEWRVNGFPVIVERILDNNQNIELYSEQYLPEYVNVLRSIRGRAFAGHGTNIVPITEWENFMEKLNTLIEQKKVVLQWRDGVKSEIQKIIDAPRVSVDLSEDGTRVTLTVHKGETFLVRQISGMRATQKKDKFWIMRAELPQVWERLHKEDKIEWSNSAREACLKEQAKKEELDKINLLEDVEIAGVDFNGIILRPFQRKGIKWLELNGYRGWLGDQMGLGKTLQGLGAFLRLRWNLKPKAKLLVVCPANLKTNWIREIQSKTDLQVYSLAGSQPDNYQLKKLFTQKDSWDIVVINYDILGTKIKTAKEDKTASGLTVRSDIEERFPWVEFLNLINFDMIIFDEVHYAKNMDANRTKAVLLMQAPHLIGMTGTPILNRPGELFPFLHMLDSSKFPSYDGYLWQYTWNGKEARNINQLREALKTLLLRRTKKEVMADLPPINRIYEWHSLSEGARDSYRKVQAGIYETLAEWNPEAAGSQQEVTSILAQIMRMKQICAVDKIEATADLALNLSDADDNGGKVLVFTQFVPVAKEIAKRLMPESVLYYGEIPMHERQKIIDAFISDPKLKFFVATWKTAGQGLNLQCANSVVFNDLGWTPAEHQQAEERAYGRLADPHPINSYYNVVEGSIEEWIQEILASKLELIETVVEGLDTERSKSVASQLLKKMKDQMRKGVKI